MERIGTTSCGDLLCMCVAELFARTNVGLVENAGDATRLGSGLALGDLCLNWPSCTESAGDGARGSCVLREGFLARAGDGTLCLGGESKTGVLSCGGVRTGCGLGIWALGGGATMDEGGSMELEGDTGTELTWMMSSWKSAGGFMLVVLSILSLAGSGVEVFTRSLLLGLACLGGRGGGGNSCSAGPAMMILLFWSMSTAKNTEPAQWNDSGERAERVGSNVHKVRTMVDVSWNGSRIMWG